MAPISTFLVEGAGTPGVDGVYVRDDFEWKSADGGRGVDRRPKMCSGSDVFRKPGTSFALLRKGNAGWSLADMRGSSTITWSLRAVELYFAARVPAGSSPPTLGWTAVDGVSPAPVIQPTKAAALLPALTKTVTPAGVAAESMLVRTGRSAVSRAASEPRLPRASRAALTLAVLGAPKKGTIWEEAQRADSSTFVSIFRVTLVRPNARMRWGFSFAGEAHRRSGTRLLDGIEPDSPLARWNLWQEVRKRKDLCVTPGDRLVRADGLWAAHNVEVGRQDGDRARDAVAQGNGGAGDCLVLDFARPVLRPPRPCPPALESWEAAPPALVVSWKAAAEEQSGAKAWALCLVDLEEKVWYVVDGATKASQPVTRAYADVGAFRPDQGVVGISEGLPAGRTYAACVSVRTEKGWSAFSELSRSALLRIDAGALGTSAGAMRTATDNWPGRVRFAVPREITAGASFPLELSPGPRELLGAGRRLRLRLVVRGAAEELQTHVRPTGSNSALLVEADINAQIEGQSSLIFHGASISMLPQAGDVIVRLNGISGAPTMFAELQRGPEVIAMTIERWAGGNSAEEMTASLPELAFVVDLRLDPSMIKAAEEISCVLLTPEEGVLASRMTESDPERLEDALRRVATATDMTPPLKCVFPTIMEDAERRLNMARRVAAAIPASPATVADEKALGILRQAMASASFNEEELKAAIKQVGQAPQAVRSSPAARALVQRAEELRKLWQWRRRCASVHMQLLEALEDGLQHEADVHAGYGAEDEYNAILHDVNPLSKALTTAKEFSSEMDFDYQEAVQVLGRLQRANARYTAQQGLQTAACDTRQDKTALSEAIEVATKSGVNEHLLAAGRDRLDSWREEHKRAAHHNELFTALQALQRHLESRDKPGAGVDEQRRLRKALAGSGLPPDAPLAMQAALALKHWEAANGSLRAEARLRSAVDRAKLGYSLDEPAAGDLLGSAIAEVSQRGVDPSFLAEAREVLRRWQESRVRHAKRSLAQAVQYRDEEHLVESLKLGRQAGLEEEELQEAESFLQRLRWEDEVNRRLEAAMEADDANLLEEAVQQAHDRCFLEKDNCWLRSAALQFHVRFWSSEIGLSLATDAIASLEVQLKAADARLEASREAIVTLQRAGASEIAIRTLERDSRSLDLMMPRAGRLAAAHAAERALKRVLTAVERHAAELPAVIATGKAQIAAGLDPALVAKAENHLRTYTSTVERLEHLVSSSSSSIDDLRTALISARLAGASEALIAKAFVQLESHCADTAARTRTELELHLAIQEADDVGVLPAEGRFLRLQKAADDARHLQPPLETELMEQVRRVSIALAAERTLVLAVADAKALLAGAKTAGPREVESCAETLARACTSASQDAQAEAQKGLPAAMELGLQLRQEAEHRQGLLDDVQKEVKASGSGAQDLRRVLIAAREGFLPGSLLTEAYAKLRRKKLENITLNLYAAYERQNDALARALWQRGRGLGAADERTGEDWRTDRFQELEAPSDCGELLYGRFTAECCGGSFGTRTWRQNPWYIVRYASENGSLSPWTGAPMPRIAVAVAEVSGEPANLSVHVVRNSEAAAAAGCGPLLVPGFEVLAQSKEDEEMPQCSFDLTPNDRARPIFIVPSSARGEEGPFMLTVEANVPIEVTVVPLELRADWAHEHSLEIEWSANVSRPSPSMGGSRTLARSPLLSWYRNPQFRITGAPKSEAPKSEASMPVIQMERPKTLTPPNRSTSRQRMERKATLQMERKATLQLELDAQDEEAGVTAEDGDRHTGVSDEDNPALSEVNSNDGGALLLAILTPEDGDNREPAAVHVLRNSQEGTWATGLLENPQLHRVLAFSGFPEAEYSEASEVGAVCRVPLDGEGVIVMPSLERRKSEGRYNLQILSTEQIVVERIT